MGSEAKLGNKKESCIKKKQSVQYDCTYEYIHIICKNKIKRGKRKHKQLGLLSLLLLASIFEFFLTHEGDF